MTTVTHEDLLRQLDYCSETGIFRWKVNRKNTKVQAGDIAGTPHKVNRYRYIYLNSKLYFEHRLAWFYVYGVWPVNQIDHKNQDRTDNRINNLREASNAQNASNRTVLSNNTSGFKGVTWDRNRNKWRAKLIWNNKTISLGNHTCPIEAARAYDSKALELHGEFAVTNASLGLI